MGHEWDQVRGESMGEEGVGAGEEESGNTRPAPACCRLGIGPYRGVGAVSNGFLSMEAAAAAAAAW